MVLRELNGNIPSTSTVSSVARGFLNKFLCLGVELGEVFRRVILRKRSYFGLDVTVSKTPG